MMKWFAKRGIAAFERRWGYDASYMREVVDEAGVGALMPANALAKLAAYRGGLPADVYAGAAVPTAKAADCGPCLQLGVRMAEESGVAPAILRALLADDRDALPEGVRCAYDLAKSVIARDGSGDEARAEIRRRYGYGGLVAIAYGMIVAGAYPTIKYVLGYGHACVRVRVAGEDVALRPAVRA